MIRVMGKNTRQNTKPVEWSQIKDIGHLMKTFLAMCMRHDLADRQRSVTPCYNRGIEDSTVVHLFDH